MSVGRIKSRPIYKGLVPDASAKRHLIVAEGEGAEAVAALEAEASYGFLERAAIFYVVSGARGQEHKSRLEALGADVFYSFPSIPTLLFRLNGVLTTATMGVRLYVSGTEGFIGQVLQAALSHGIDHQCVLTEHHGSLARRVQCIHCKGFTEMVKTNLVKCEHCGITLLVRDHYSRRLGAFMGVSADAETPGELPPSQENFP